MSVSCWYGCSDCDSSSLTGTMNYLWIVKDLLVIAVPLSCWNQPGLPPSWGNSGKQILISKSLIVGRKSAKRNCCGKMCRLRVVLWRLCGHSGSACLPETVCFVTNGKVAKENRHLTWLFFLKASDRLLLNLIIQLSSYDCKSLLCYWPGLTSAVHILVTRCQTGEESIMLL